MITAFQSNAFQNDAFQIYIPPPPLPGVPPSIIDFRPIIIGGRIYEIQEANREEITCLIIISGIMNCYQNMFINNLDIFVKSKYEKDLEDILLLAALDD